MLRRKPLWLIERQAKAQQHSVPRAYDLASLLAVGIGGTVGSGIFVLAGSIARSHAGAATCVSWAVAGAVCGVTALAYAELSCRVPSAGSTYTFAFHGLGEVFGVCGAWFLSLECGMSGAAVSRSWGDKLAFYLSDLELLGCGAGRGCWVNSLGGSGVNVGAGAVCVAAVTLLLSGVEVSRVALNVLVVLKLALVLFVIAAGFAHFDAQNLHPFLPPPSEDPAEPDLGGAHGVLVGSTVAYFGYVGFDEVACLTLEATRPKKDLPIAILGTIAVITALYMLASLALVGMVPAASIDPQEGFGSALEQVGARWAMHIVMVGQIVVVLPAVVLVSFLPQSRLQCTVAADGMLPPVFARRDASGNLFFGTLLSGVAMTLVALVTPFRKLNELISAGILLSFVLTNASLLAIRAEHDAKCLALIVALVLVSAATAFAFAAAAAAPVALRAALALAVLALVALLARRMPAPTEEVRRADVFLVPLVPLTPALSIQANWVLFAQLSSTGLVQIGVFVGCILLLYALVRSYKVLVYAKVETSDVDVDVEDEGEGEGEGGGEDERGQDVDVGAEADGGVDADLHADLDPELEVELTAILT